MKHHSILSWLAKIKPSEMRDIQKDKRLEGPGCDLCRSLMGTGTRAIWCDQGWRTLQHVDPLLCTLVFVVEHNRSVLVCYAGSGIEWLRIKWCRSISECHTAVIIRPDACPPPMTNCVTRAHHRASIIRRRRHLEFQEWSRLLPMESRRGRLQLGPAGLRRLASEARTKSTGSVHNLLRQPICLTLQRGVGDGGGASLAFEMDSIPPPLKPSDGCVLTTPSSISRQCHSLIVASWLRGEQYGLGLRNVIRDELNK